MIKFFIVAASYFVFSCTRAEKDSLTRVSILIPEHLTGADSSIKARGLNPNGSIVPAGLAEINCLVVLASGPEADLSRNACRMEGDTRQFNVGFHSRGFFLGRPLGGATAASTLSLDIRSGADRAIRLVGFKVAAANGSESAASEICSGFFTNPDFQSQMSDPFLLAEATGLQLNGGEVQVPLSATLAASNQVGDCTGPDFPPLTSPQNPVAPQTFKLAITMQDAAGTATHPLTNSSCVGVKFQLQNPDGSAADLSSNPAVKVTIKVSPVSNLLSGSFFQANGAGNCVGSSLMNPGGGDATLSFNRANGSLFRDHILFFQPYAANDGVKVFAVKNGGSIENVVETSFGFSFTAANSGPVRYAFYDLLSNVSSETVTDKDLEVNVCRPASVQFVDANGVPTITAYSGAQQMILVSANTTPIQYFSSSVDCSATSTSPIYLSAPTETMSSRNFYYRLTGAVGHFGFYLQNYGTGTPVVASGDVTSPASTWTAH